MDTCVSSMSTADNMFTAIYHDSVGRVIQEVSSNILGGYDSRMTAYHSCLTVPKQTIETHSTPKEWHRDVYDYEYGPWNRLVRMWMTHDGDPKTELLRNEYDALGRLSSQTLGDSITTAYTYHLHGGISSTSNPYFSQQLYYEKRPDGSAGLLNGDLCAYRWRSAADGGRTDDSGGGVDGLWRGYTYSYDGADRLVSAVYGETGSRPATLIADSPDYSEYRTYDAGSNLATLKACGLTDRQRVSNLETKLSSGR
ncbi:hypothetical protein [uncultured Muribaculum sp.]|uniref:hypothetical protein n=2 Tax=uncultured Muribaculum sp. TaxID=1918613 RepID=UPI0025E3B840|nr:hypothetical protein [uncultured Muribaculum sp.]